jgi:hypothetical protein
LHFEIKIMALRSNTWVDFCQRGASAVAELLLVLVKVSTP